MANKLVRRFSDFIENIFADSQKEVDATADTQAVSTEDNTSVGSDAALLENRSDVAVASDGSEDTKIALDAPAPDVNTDTAQYARSDWAETVAAVVVEPLANGQIAQEFAQAPATPAPETGAEAGNAAASSWTTWSFLGLGALGAAGGIAAGIGLSGGSSSSVGPTPTPAPLTPTPVPPTPVPPTPPAPPTPTPISLRGQVVAGQATAGIKVTAFDANGNEIASTVTDSTGSYGLSIAAKYKNTRIQITASDPNPGDGLGYRDEVSGQQRDFRVDIRAVTTLGDSDQATVYITPLTEIAVRQLGAAPSAADIATVNKAIGTLFGVSDDIVGSAPSVAGPSGTSQINAYGRALLLLSGADNAEAAKPNPQAATLDTLASGIAIKDGVAKIQTSAANSLLINAKAQVSASTQPGVPDVEAALPAPQQSSLLINASQKVLFVGNSATFGRVDPVESYNVYDPVKNPDGVRDLTAPVPGTTFANLAGTNLYEPHPWGGLAGLFDRFAKEVGLEYDTSLSTRNAATLQGHYSNSSPPNPSTPKWDLRGNIASSVWDKVILQEQTDRPITKGSGSITFNAGQSEISLIITPKADKIKEFDETISLTLKSDSKYNPATTGKITTTILNDDPTGPVINPNLPTVTISSNGAVLEDGPNNLVYTFTRTGPTTADLIVTFALDRDGSVSPSIQVGNKTPPNGAVNDSDFEGYNAAGQIWTSGSTTGFSPYRFASGSVSTVGTMSFTNKTGSITIKAGQTTATLTLDPSADKTVEADESIRITLTSTNTFNSGTVGAVSATIINDDFAGPPPPLPSVAVALSSPSAVYEDTGNRLIYTFTRTGSTANPLTVNFDVDGLASYWPSDMKNTDFTITTTGGSAFTFKTTGGANADIDGFSKYASLIAKYIQDGSADSTTLPGVTIPANPNKNPNAEIYLYSTWPRPDSIAGAKDIVTNKTPDPAGSGASVGGTITVTDTEAPAYFLRLEDMGQDLVNAYNGLAAANPAFKGVAAVSLAFVNAVTQGVSIRDPYTEQPGNGKINLWFDDNLHASKYGSYLAGLMLFGTVTGVDPRAVGKSDGVAVDLGIDQATAVALQNVAAATLSKEAASRWFSPGTIEDLGNNTNAILATAGGFNFQDTAFNRHTVEVRPIGGALGTLKAELRSDGNVGQVNWVYSVDNAVIDPLLSPGQTRTEKFNILLSSGDGSGSFASKEVDVLLKGAQSFIA